MDQPDRLKLFVYQEGRDFELSPACSDFPNSRRPIELLRPDDPTATPPFDTVDDPLEADFLVYPYNLECLVYPERAIAASYFIRRLPHFHALEERHVFFNFHDRNQPLVTNALIVTNDPNKYNAGDRFIAPFPHPPGQHVVQAAPDFAFGRIGYDTNFIGALSYPCRYDMVTSVEKHEGLHYFIHYPTTLDWADQSTSFHHMTDEAKKQEARNLFVQKMKQSWTSLCPRGMGSSSIRFFETLCMGRIPVHISDAYILPRYENIAYDDFCLFISEDEAAHTGDILYEWLEKTGIEERAAMCLAARKAWETHFRPEHFQEFALEILRRHKRTLETAPVERQAFRRPHELLSAPGDKVCYPPGYFETMQIDDSKTWLNSGVHAPKTPDGELVVNGYRSSFGLVELTVLIDFAANLPANAVVLYDGVEKPAGLIAFLTGLLASRNLNAAVYAADSEFTPDHADALRDTGVHELLTVLPAPGGRGILESAALLREGSVDAFVSEARGLPADEALLARMKPSGVLLARGRLHPGFMLQAARPGALEEVLFDTLEDPTPGGAAPLHANAVLGLLSGPGKEHAEAFVQSLRATSFRGDIVLFVTGIDQETSRFLLARGCRIVCFTPGKRFRHVPLDSLRPFLFQRFLREAGTRYKNAFLTDVEGVTFQGDVFSVYTPGDLWLFEEPRLLRDAPRTRRWIEALYGSEAAQHLDGHPVLHAGAVLGDAHCVRGYLARMTEHLYPFQFALPETPGASGTPHGPAQAVHNHLARGGLPVRLRILDNSQGVVRAGAPGLPSAPGVPFATAEGVPFLVVHRGAAPAEQGGG